MSANRSPVGVPWNPRILGQRGADEEAAGVAEHVGHEVDLLGPAGDVDDLLDEVELPLITPA